MVPAASPGARLGEIPPEEADSDRKTYAQDVGKHSIYVFYEDI